MVTERPYQPGVGAAGCRSNPVAPRRGAGFTPRPRTRGSCHWRRPRSTRGSQWWRPSSTSVTPRRLWRRLRIWRRLCRRRGLQRRGLRAPFSWVSNPRGIEREDDAFDGCSYCSLFAISYLSAPPPTPPSGPGPPWHGHRANGDHHQDSSPRIRCDSRALPSRG